MIIAADHVAEPEVFAALVSDIHVTFAIVVVLVDAIGFEHAIDSEPSNVGWTRKNRLTSQLVVLSPVAMVVATDVAETVAMAKRHYLLLTELMVVTEMVVEVAVTVVVEVAEA